MTDSITGYSDGDIDTNHTSNPTLGDMIQTRYSRRQTLFGGASAAALAVFGTTLLSACDEDENGSPTVSAGTNASTRSGRVVTLAGTASDSDGIGSVTWTQISGPTVTLTATGNNATFLAPSVAADTEFKFRFTASDTKGAAGNAETTITIQPAALGFTAVGHSKIDRLEVPIGYSFTVMTRLGDPIAAGTAAYQNDGTDTDFANRIGDHGDALYWYGLSAAGARDDNSSTRGLMVQNHENITEPYLHIAGITSSGGVRPEAEVLKEIEAHGVSVVEYRDAGNRQWSYVQDSAFNRRITPHTPMVFNGPVRGSDSLKTPFSTAGTDARGTINNCANGHTLWGTNITCEENWAGYFRRSGDDAQRTPRELTALRRYGVTSSTGNYGWSTVSPSTAGDTRFSRWDARATVGGSATTDFRNEPNQFGWCVELDPYDKTKAPRKRTALGRLGHEGAWFGRFLPGKKLAVYLGDDAINEYFYKYVSNASWSEGDISAADRLAIGDKYLDDGKLYAAKFNDDGTGNWIELKHGVVPDRPADALGPVYVFADQNDILVNPRLAADAVGATPMDRPEWTATNNATGEIYLTLTNNGNRRTPADSPDVPPAFDNPANTTTRATDAANPRVYVDQPSTSRSNRNGHILRLREVSDDPAALTFNWDIYLFGADSAEADPSNVNLSGLNTTNDFSSPDGLWFARPQNASGLVNPVLWIQTDDSAFTSVTNNQMLAAMPGTTGDGGARTITNIGPAGPGPTQTTRVGAAATEATLKRFLVGPIGCEITGVDTTPDGRTLFVGIQHPGELPGGTVAPPNPPPSSWPATEGGASTARPRSAIVAITKNDGGVVAL